MKVLIITYYWPPAGGSGVQRWLKFVKYFREFGIEPIVYTVSNPIYPIVDDTLSGDIPSGITIIKQPIFEPNHLLSRFQKNSNKESAGFLNPNPSGLGKLLQYIRANFFIPDARKYWVAPSVKYLKSYITHNHIDAIITTGPPHSVHLIGLALKKKLGLTWIADFRDPWTEIDYFEQLPLTNRARKKHALLEQEVLHNADEVLVVGKTMQENFRWFNKNIHVVANGFDSDEGEIELALNSNFTLTHVGLMNADRNPYSFWKAIKELCDEDASFAKDYEVQLVGSVAPEVINLINKYQLVNVSEIGYVSHQEVKEYQLRSQVLLLAVNKVKSAKGIITGKIFEYLQAKRPILAIGPVDGDLAEILRDTKSGKIFGFDDVASIKKEIAERYNAFKKGDVGINPINIEYYHRRNLTKKLSEIIKATILN